MSDKFAVFILTYGRAGRVDTDKTLRKCGYSGEIYYIVSDDDKQMDEYKKLYGDKVIVFNKDEAAKECKIDRMDNLEKKNIVVYARNYATKVAKELGIRYHLQLDDDYTDFYYRINSDLSCNKYKKIKNLDKVIESYLDYYKKAKKIKTLAWAQGGDFIGGCKNDFAWGFKSKRKAMNAFFIDCERDVRFIGSINEDTNTYVYFGMRGDVFLTINAVWLNQKTTQKNKGGLTDAYLDSGTYVKSFYSVIAVPSAVKIGIMGDKYMRIHHRVRWNACVPKIVRGRAQDTRIK